MKGSVYISLSWNQELLGIYMDTCYGGIIFILEVPGKHEEDVFGPFLKARLICAYRHQDAVLFLLRVSWRRVLCLQDESPQQLCSGNLNDVFTLEQSRPWIYLAT